MQRGTKRGEKRMRKMFWTILSFEDFVDTIKEWGEEKCIFTMYVKKKRIYVYLPYKYITISERINNK